MTHLHFPDGILPIWIVLLGFGLTVILLTNSLRRLRKEDEFARKVSLVAIMAALMLIANSIPMGFIHFHMNLTVLVSLLIGPWNALLAAFVVNFALSLIGHGGITVVGLNTLIFGGEIFLAALLYRGLVQKFSMSTAVFSTVITALLISTGLMVSIVMLAALTVDPILLGMYLEKGSGLAAGIIPWFATLILPVAIAGAMVEGLVTIGIVKYLAKVKPELVEHIRSTNIMEGKNT